MKDVCENIDFRKRNVIVEYGPGTGVFTRYLLERLSADSLLISIEKNESFAKNLRKIDDPRLSVFHSSAADVRAIVTQCNERQIDYIISGIPFSMIPEGTTRRILEDSRGVLAPDGTLLVYQVRPSVEQLLKGIFPHVTIRKVFRNMPPLFVFEAKKEQLR